MSIRYLLFAPSVFLAISGALSSAKADVAEVRICLEEHALGMTSGTPKVSESVPDAEALLKEVGTFFGMSRDIAIIPCGVVQKAESWATDANGLTQTLKDAGVRPGRYVLYNPVWVREVIGNDRDQAIFLFGHEFGHFVRGHFFERRDIASKEKELEADQFGGCATARMGSSWDSVKSLVSKIRPPESDGFYPSASDSLAIVEGGFTGCGGKTVKMCQKPENGVENWGLDVNVQRESNPRGGGGSQPGYCAELIQSLRTEYPNGTLFEVMDSGERSYTDCAPFNCPKYVYRCLVNVKGEPKYLSAPCKE